MVTPGKHPQVSRGKGTIQKGPSSKAAGPLGRGAYTEDVSTTTGRERRWRTLRRREGMLFQQPPNVYGVRQWAGLMVIGYLMTACSAPSLYSYLVYENPTSFVRLEIAPWVDTDVPEMWNAHPATLSRRQIDTALRGLRVREHRSAPIQWLRGVAEIEPAFREEEIELLAPRLLEGLNMAVPQEMVTFYLSHPVNATKREVTSGGVYVTDGQLHVILSNYRTIYGIPPAGLIYDRRYPLFSLAPTGVDILYEAEDMVLPKEEGFLEGMFGDERSDEIVLDLSRLSMMKI